MSPLRFTQREWQGMARYVLNAPASLYRFRLAQGLLAGAYLAAEFAAGLDE